MEIIDTHCHLDLPAFDTDRGQVLARARGHRIVAIVVPGVRAAGWPPLLRICRAHPALYPALGLHPIFVGEHTDNDLDELRTLLQNEHTVAVGEIGLDFYLGDLDRARQLVLLEAQLALARDFALPVILHVRKAHEEVLAALRRTRVIGGIAHAFNGSLDQAKRYLDLGFKLGFGGMLTYERSVRLRKLARDLPLEAMVLETDAPDMTVAQHRGGRNSPEYLPYCLAALAEIRAQPVEQVAAVTTKNARAVLGLVGEEAAT